MIENPNVICNDCGFCKQYKELKELLKKCKPYIAFYVENNKYIGFTPETANLLRRIKEKIKDD